MDLLYYMYYLSPIHLCTLIYLYLAYKLLKFLHCALNDPPPQRSLPPFPKHPDFASSHPGHRPSISSTQKINCMGGGGGGSGRIIESPYFQFEHIHASLVINCGTFVCFVDVTPVQVNICRGIRAGSTVLPSKRIGVIYPFHNRYPLDYSKINSTLYFQSCPVDHDGFYE